MKNVIYYYSTTGNTRLVCEALKRLVVRADFELVSITDAKANQADQADPLSITGFACFTDQFGIPVLMERFMDSLGSAPKGYAFVLNTFGSISGRTQLDLKRAARRNGYRVVDGIAVHSPENYPPMIRGGMGFQDKPGEAGLMQLSAFIRRLDETVSRISSGEIVRATRLKGEVSQHLVPRLPKFLTRVTLGSIIFDAKKCCHCGKCATGCPSRAISILADGLSYSVDRERCLSCWKCYNNCPTGAIFGTRFPHECRYSRVNEIFRNKIQGLSPE